MIKTLVLCLVLSIILGTVDKMPKAIVWNKEDSSFSVEDVTNDSFETLVSDRFLDVTLDICKAEESEMSAEDIKCGVCKYDDPGYQCCECQCEVHAHCAHVRGVCSFICFGCFAPDKLVNLFIIPRVKA